MCVCKENRRIPIFNANISGASLSLSLSQKKKFLFVIFFSFFLLSPFLATLYSVIFISHPYLRERRPGSSLGLLCIYEPPPPPSGPFFFY